ncbi:hypothetical protein BLA18110_00005 [Burkholderia lata]|nr:hypothetical protein BLA18110_00005 [Burkholderia lata]
MYNRLMRNGDNMSRLPATGVALIASYTHRWCSGPA